MFTAVPYPPKKNWEGRGEAAQRSLSSKFTKIFYSQRLHFISYIIIVALLYLFSGYTTSAFFSLLALVWRSAPLAPLYLKEKKAPRDFIGLNKGAVQAGLTTAHEHFQYRATHDMRRKDSGNEKTSLKVKRIPPTMVFGIPTKYV